jgi:hypothetical protein
MVSVMTKAWISTNFDEACKRAGGRRRYQAERQKAQWQRQVKVLRELEESNWESYGMGRMLAKRLGVSEATISRDLRHWRSMRRKLGADANEIIASGLRAWHSG